jgi:bifunctional non-homologous end joining protein LigD
VSPAGAGESAAPARARAPAGPRGARLPIDAGAGDGGAAPSGRRSTERIAAWPGVRRAPLPRSPGVQLATLVAAAPDGPEWLHEIKFDGYRIVARLEHGAARLLSRNGKDWTERFPEVAAAVARLPARDALLDGEVAAVLPGGITSFQALQNVLSGGRRATVAYYLFDLLHLDGLDLTRAPLEARKEALRDLVRAASDPLRFSDHVVGSGPEVLRQACGMSVEGIVSKRRDAPYEARRSGTWLKVKCLRGQEVVIGGFTEPTGTRTALGALLIGVHDEQGALRYAGKVGTGFTTATLRALHRRLRALEVPRSPFADRIPGAARAHWVRPELVAEVAFTEWTDDGKLRHPSFKGLREDKAAADVVRERPAGAPDGPAPARQPAPPRPDSAPPVADRAAGRPRDGVAFVAGVRLTHPDRVLYPVQGTTKRDLARFYESIADRVLPGLRGRPLTLVRCPEGTARPCFYMKHSGVWAPPALRRIRIQEKTKLGEYLVVEDLAGLVSLVQMGVLEIHTWNSTTEHLEQPDRVVFDLDPGPAVGWPRVVEAARQVRAALDRLGLEGFVRTTGGKGLHVVAPLVPEADWSACFELSRAVAEAMVREDPAAYTTEMPKAPREDKILVDYLRNRRGNTSIASYSTRARPGAPVAVPLAWEELDDPGLTSDRFTISSLPARLASLPRDPWARYERAARRLPGAERPRATARGTRRPRARGEARAR